MQIEASHLHIGNMKNYWMNKYRAYPPNFTISVDGNRAESNDTAEFTFEGALPAQLVYDIPLILPEAEVSSKKHVVMLHIQLFCHQPLIIRVGIIYSEK